LAPGLAILGLGRLRHGGPAEIAALRALGRLEVAEPVAAGDPGGPAVEAFDDERLHPRVNRRRAAEAAPLSE
jgi:hypothetical protein